MSSKYDDILSAAKGEAPAQKKAKKKASKPAAPKGAGKQPARPGRPSGPAGGKRSREDYRQGSVYLPLTMFDDVRDKLSAQNRGKRAKQDFSGLVEQLLADWLKRT
jgi:hypothetical protein